MADVGGGGGGGCVGVGLRGFFLCWYHWFSRCLYWVGLGGVAWRGVAWGFGVWEGFCMGEGVVLLGGVCLDGVRLNGRVRLNGDVRWNRCAFD